MQDLTDLVLGLFLLLEILEIQKCVIFLQTPGDEVNQQQSALLIEVNRGFETLHDLNDRVGNVISVLKVKVLLKSSDFHQLQSFVCLSKIFTCFIMISKNCFEVSKLSEPSCISRKSILCLKVIEIS